MANKDEREVNLGVDAPEAEESERNPEKMILTNGEIRKMLDNTSTLRDRVLIQILVETHLRAGTVAELKLQDVSIVDREIKYSNMEVKDAIVPISDELALGIQCYSETERPDLNRSEELDHLFISRAGRPLSIQGIHSIITQTAEKSGLNEGSADVQSEDDFDQQILKAVTYRTLRRTSKQLLTGADSEPTQSEPGLVCRGSEGTENIAHHYCTPEFNPDVLLVGRYLSEMRGEYAPATIRTHRTHVTRYIDFLEEIEDTSAVEATRQQLKAFFRHLAEDYELKPTTIRNYQFTIVTFHDYLERLDGEWNLQTKSEYIKWLNIGVIPEADNNIG